MLKRLSRRLRALFRKADVEIELDEELKYHLDRQIEQNLANGMSLREARHAALRAFDGLEQSKEDCRDSRRVRLAENLVQDVRYGARGLVKNPGFTLVVAVTLALGIGANTAIFSVVNGVLLRPLPFREPDRLVMLWTDNPMYQLGFRELPAANVDLPEWRAAATSFEQIAAFQASRVDLTADDGPERVGGVSITANLLPTLGVQPVLGRQFTVEEEQPERDRVALIGYDLWQRRFGGAADVVGKTVDVNQVPYIVVGVMPEGFSFPHATELPQAYSLPEKTEIWTPLARDAEFWARDTQRQLLLVARLRDGVTQAQAQAEMDGILSEQAKVYPESHEGWSVWMTPLLTQIVGPARTPLLILLGAVGFLLLIACANIASLLLARSMARRREMAVRAAIGAGRARMVRQLLTESLVLAALGGGLGVLFGYAGLNALLGVIPPNVPRVQDVSLDARVLIFTTAITILTGMLFGLVPAWQASKVNLVEVLKDAGRAGSSALGVRSHGLLVTTEVALVAVLLVGAVLMLQSFRQLQAVSPGFEPEGVATFGVALSWSKYFDGEQRGQVYEQARARLGALPGVRAAGAVSNLPLGSNENVTWVAVDGAPPVPRGKEPIAEDRVITPGYLDAMGVTLVAGRDFEATDGPSNRRVALVNETLARKFFPDGDAVGKRIKRVLDDEAWLTIVGVVGDVRGYALDVQVRPQLYHPLAQDPWQDQMSIVLRVDAAALPSMRAAIRQELATIDPALPVADFHTMTQLVSRAVARPRFSTLLLGLFAGTALLLTVVGLYGVVAYGVTQRTREIGIRMALGARQTNVLGLVIRQGMRPTLVGLGIGLVGALALARLLASQLYEVSPTDPATYAGVGAILFLVGVAACYLPARRAAKVSPTEALRLGD